MHTSRKLVLIAALLTSQLSAQTTTTITGTIKDLTNSVVTSGKVTFTLTPNRDTTISGVARFTPTTVTCLINGSGLIKAQDGVSTCTLTMNTALSPPGSYYTVAVWPYFVKTSSFNFYAVLSTYDWSTVVPTPATSPAQNYADVFSNQTIGGNKTFSGSTTFTGSLTLDFLNNVVYPIAGESLATALAQLGGPGHIVFGPGTYPSGGASISTADITIEGAEMPGYNSLTAPTALTGGTIIQGTIAARQGADRLVIRNLGCDVGSAWVNGSNGGVAVDCLGIYNNGAVVGAPQVQGPIFENVACLGYSLSAPTHCMLMENVNGGLMRHVKAFLNQHGVVLKGTNSTIDDVESSGHSVESILVKSDDYALSNDDTISNIYIHSLAAPGDTLGLSLSAVAGPLSNIAVVNGTFESISSHAVIVAGSAAPTPATGISLTNLAMNYPGAPGGTYGIQFQQYVQDASVENCSIFNYPIGIANNTPVAQMNDISVSHCHFVNNATVGVQSFGRWTVTGNTFTTVGIGLQSDSGTMSECNNYFASVSTRLAGAGTFSWCGQATEDTSGNVSFVGALGPGKAAIGAFTACSAALEGEHAIATNCNAGCVAGNACAAGGATHCEMYCSATPAWVETGR